MQTKLQKFSLIAFAWAAALGVLPMEAGAAGLGRMTVVSAMGQPLRAEIEIMASREELASLSARLSSHDAFKQAGIEFAPVLSGIKFVVDKRPSGQAIIRLTSDRPVNEPFLDVLIELNWAGGRLVREYTFLLDPAPEVLTPKAATPITGLPAAAAQPTPAAPAVPQAAPPPASPEARAVAPIDEKLPGKQADESAAKKPGDEAGTHEVKRGENLRKIAAATKPEGVSLDQMLVAIFRSNKDAFIGDNMHRLKAGKILEIPDAAAVASITEPDSKRIIAAQTADFNAYRQKLAEAAGAAEPPKEQAAPQAVAGKIAPKVEDKVPLAAEGKDQLKVSKSESAKEVKTAQGRIAALEEDLSARDKALKEAQSRQADLEKNVSELKKLVELKNQSLAELQRQAAAKPSSVPESIKSELPAAAPALPTAPAKAPEAPVQAPPVVAEKPAEPAKPAEAAPAPIPPVAAEKPAEALKPVAKKPAPEPGFLEELTDNPAILGGGVVILALLGFVAYRLRRQHKQAGVEATPTTTANLGTNSVFGATGGRSVDTTGSSMASDFSQASISAIDANEGVDPVAEADVYMAYGRDAQAEEILLDALKTDPTRTAIHVKLLEIYSARKNTKQFETTASDLYAQTGGVGADWEKAAAMGQKLDPANPLYGGSAAAEPPHPFATDTTVIVPAGEKGLRDTWTAPGELSQIAEQVERGAATVVLDKELAAAAAESPAGLDFDLDLGAQVAAPAAPTKPVVAPTRPAAQTKATPAEPAGLDFDLGLDFQPAGAKPAAQNLEATVITNVSAPRQAAADMELDLSLDEPPPSASAAPAAGEIHFDLDLGQPAASEAFDPEKTIARDAALDFDFNLGSQPAPRPAPSVDFGSINLDLAPPAAEPAVSDEVATKLELAKAYEEMGDKEGARELLQEVVNEGNAEQLDKARGILARLG